MKNWKKRWMSLALAVVLLATTVLGGQILSRAADAPTGDTYVYLPASDPTTASRYGGSGLYGNFVDGFQGGDASCANPTLLLQQAGDYVEYDFDLDDQVEEAVLKVHASGAVVSVKPSGGAGFLALSARNGGTANRGVNLYALTKDNALSSGDRKFTVRIEFGGATVVLNNLAVTAVQPELKERYELAPLGESYLCQLWDVSAGASRYFDQGTIPTVHLHVGEFVTLRFDYDDTADEIAYAYSNVGGAMKAEAGTDGVNWTVLPGTAGNLSDAIALSVERVFYMRFSAGDAETFLKSLTLTPTYPALPPEPAVEQAELYLPIQDLTSASRFGGSTIVENFNDQYMGGDLASNPSLLLQSAGDYVEYDVNLPDDVENAVLKVYMKDAVVSVKPEGGAYQTLTARNEAGGRFDRNLAIYDLDTANALSHAGRQFTVRVSANGVDAAVLNGLFVETNRQEQQGSYQLDILGESFLRSVTEISQGATRYFADQKDPCLFLHQGESATFFFDFPDDTESLMYSVGILGEPVAIEISADKADWEPLPAGGRIEHTLKLNADKSFYLRFTATEGESFLKTLTIAPAQKELAVEQDYVYLRIQDVRGARSFGGNTIVENFTDTFSGGDPEKIDNKTLLLEHSGDYVEYDFNLTDQRREALLKVYMKDAVVSVKPDGGDYTVLTAVNEEGGSFDRGIAIYRLDETNALSDPGRQFTVRIESNGEAAVINGLVLDAARPRITSGWYELNPLGESFLSGVERISQSATRYFHEGYIPTVYIKDGGQVTFRLDFEPGGVAYLADYEVLGAESEVTVSLDGEHWVPLKGRRVDRAVPMEDTGTFYLRFAATEGEIFLKSLTASRRDSDPTEYNANKNVPGDSEYVYFKPGTPEEEKHMFGLGDDYKAYFAQTHDGMGIDGHEGGYLASLPENVRIFDGGRQITYEFDLADGIENARLKLYALADMDFFISTDEGDCWEKLSAQSAPTGSGRGYYIFQLDQGNALKNEDNRFRLKIQGMPFGRLFELMIESGAPALTHGVQFEAQKEDALRYLEESQGLRSYYAYEAWPNYFLDEKGSLLFKVPFASGVNQAVLYATYSGGARIAVSTERDSGYSDLLVSSIGASGTPYTNTFDLSGYLGKSRTLYIRVTGTAEGAFVDSLGIAVTPRNKGTGGFTAFDGSEADYLWQVKNNGAGVGASMRQTEDLTKVRGLDVGGEVVYRFDLPEGINGVDLKPRTKGSYNLTVSLDGENYTPVVRVGRKSSAIREQELLAKSSDKVLYVKIENTSAREILFLYGLSYTVKGVPQPYQRPETSGFDYDKSLPEHFAVVERLAAPKDPQAILAVEEVTAAEETESGIPAAAVAVAAGVVLCGGAAGGSAVYLGRRRRGRKKQ